MAVARPSPTRVRCRPGSATKLRPTVEEMAHISPMCSTMVARAMGAMVMTLVSSRPASKFVEKMENTVFSQITGRPNHFALDTAAATLARAAGSTIRANR